MKKAVIIIQLSLCFVCFAQETGARYLIIAPDAFYAAARPLAEWKYRKGMNTKLVSLSETGSSAAEIKDYISYAYYNWDIPPEYVLFVGAPNFIPLPQINSVYTDNYYTDIHGDHYNEILPGRLTVHDANEAQTVIKKILTYERTPDRTDSLWFKKACLIIRQDWDQDDSIYWSDAHYAKSLMLDAGFVKVDTFSNLYGDNQDSIVNAVHDGRGVVMFRGAGLNNWHPPFSVEPDQLDNATMLPILLSITCQTVGTGSTPCTVERWLLNGTPLALKGASAFFASTRALHYSAHLRSAVAKGFNNAWFNENKRTFGECCEGGRRMVYHMYPYSGGLDSYREFLTVGDPEMNLWTDTPCSLIVSHPVMMPIGPRTFPVTVFRAHDLSPVESALVCITGRLDSTVYALDTTDENGNAYFTIHPHIGDDSLFVTVTGLNLQPYEGSMNTFIAAVYVVYQKSEIDDSLVGNNDGLINPGEQINLPLWVRNYGDSTGMGISGCLRTADIYITIIDSSKSFGNIPGGDSAYTGSNGYDFSVANNCPDGHLIHFNLNCSDSDSNWNSFFIEKVYAAELDFEKAVITGGNGNHTFEPGETVTVVVTLRNHGGAPIDSVIADLHAASPYVNLIDSIGTYIHIGPDSTANNSSDPFTICSDSATPQGTYIDCQLILHSGYLVDTLSFCMIVGKIDYFVWSPELTPTSGQNIHALLTDLGYHGIYDTMFIPNIHEFATLFICAGIWPNNYIIDMNSPEAIALSDFIDDGGRMYLEGGDVWFYDPLHHQGYDFTPLFGISAIEDGASDMGPISGQSGTFTRAMSFAYAGENRFMDHIAPEAPGAFLIFRDVNDNYYDSYDCGVAFDQGSYRTVGTSFELGLLVDDDPPSTRAALLDSIMHFFGVIPGIAEQNLFSRCDRVAFGIYPNPIKRAFNIMFISPDERNVTIIMYDVVGRQVKVLFDGKVKTGSNYFSAVPGDLAAGIYFVRVCAGDYTSTEKIVLLK